MQIIGKYNSLANLTPPLIDYNCSKRSDNEDFAINRLGTRSDKRS